MLSDADQAVADRVSIQTQITVDAEFPEQTSAVRRHGLNADVEMRSDVLEPPAFEHHRHHLALAARKAQMELFPTLDAVEHREHFVLQILDLGGGHSGPEGFDVCPESCGHHGHEAKPYGRF